MDTGKQPQGSTFRELAGTREPSWSQGSDEKDASLGDKAYSHRVASVPGNVGKVHRFAGCAGPCALIDAPISRRAGAIHEEGRCPWCSSIPRVSEKLSPRRVAA